MTAALTGIKLRRTLAATMPARFDVVLAKGKELVADFRANEKSHLPPTFDCNPARPYHLPPEESANFSYP